jgi:hypothetical protein
MGRFEKLELSTETLRDLTSEELAQVAGGKAATTTCPGATQTFVCPSGATWFWDCQSVQVSCG